MFLLELGGARGERKHKTKSETKQKKQRWRRGSGHFAFLQQNNFREATEGSTKLSYSPLD